jgi:hypothetical protein
VWKMMREAQVAFDEDIGGRRAGSKVGQEGGATPCDRVMGCGLDFLERITCGRRIRVRRTRPGLVAKKWVLCADACNWPF